MSITGEKHVSFPQNESGIRPEYVWEWDLRPIPAANCVLSDGKLPPHLRTCHIDLNAGLSVRAFRSSSHHSMALRRQGQMGVACNHPSTFAFFTFSDWPCSYRRRSCGIRPAQTGINGYGAGGMGMGGLLNDWHMHEQTQLVSKHG